MAINSTGSANFKTVIIRIFNTLKDRGVDCLTTDNSGSNALHYAVKCGATELISVLLGHGIDFNVVNQEGQSALSLAMMGKSTPELSETNNLIEGIWLKLLKYGADPNIVYPEDSLRDMRDGLMIPAIGTQANKNKKHKRDSAASNITQASNAGTPRYSCSIMMNYILQDNLNEQKMLESFRTLMKYGARLDPVDSDGLLVLHHAIKKNNEPLIRFILSNSQELVDQFDSEGRSAAHLCVQPYAFGSYENK